ncbi:hypothetical protein U9M48_027577, partial [Paspalum notatum var. saurae]
GGWDRWVGRSGKSGDFISPVRHHRCRCRPCFPPCFPVLCLPLLHTQNASLPAWKLRGRGDGGGGGGGGGKQGGSLPRASLPHPDRSGTASLPPPLRLLVVSVPPALRLPKPPLSWCRRRSSSPSSRRRRSLPCRVATGPPRTVSPASAFTQSSSPTSINVARIAEITKK